MIATNPITINGEVYDRWSINLAITGKYLKDGSADASICMKLIPTRIIPESHNEDGNIVPACVITADDQAIGIFRGRLAEVTDSVEQAAISAITLALQNYISSKGL